MSATPKAGASGAVQAPSILTTDTTPQNSGSIPPITTIPGSMIATGLASQNIFELVYSKFFYSDSTIDIPLSSKRGDVIFNIGMISEHMPKVHKLMFLLSQRFAGMIYYRLTIQGMETIAGTVDLLVTPQKIDKPTLNDGAVISRETISLNKTSCQTIAMGTVVGPDGIMRMFYPTENAFSDNNLTMPHLVMIVSTPLISSVENASPSLHINIEAKLGEDSRFAVADVAFLEKMVDKLSSSPKTDVSTLSSLQLKYNGMPLHQLFKQHKDQQIILAYDGSYNNSGETPAGADPVDDWVEKEYTQFGTFRLRGHHGAKGTLPNWDTSQHMFPEQDAMTDGTDAHYYRIQGLPYVESDSKVQWKIRINELNTTQARRCSLNYYSMPNQTFYIPNIQQPAPGNHSIAWDGPTPNVDLIRSRQLFVVTLGPSLDHDKIQYKVMFNDGTQENNWLSDSDVNALSWTDFFDEATIRKNDTYYVKILTKVVLPQYLKNQFTIGQLNLPYRDSRPASAVRALGGLLFQHKVTGELSYVFFVCADWTSQDIVAQYDLNEVWLEYRNNNSAIFKLNQGGTSFLSRSNLKDYTYVVGEDIKPLPVVEYARCPEQARRLVFLTKYPPSIEPVVAKSEFATVYSLTSCLEDEYKDGLLKSGQMVRFQLLDPNINQVVFDVAYFPLIRSFVIQPRVDTDPLYATYNNQNCKDMVIHNIVSTGVMPSLSRSRAVSLLDRVVSDNATDMVGVHVSNAPGYRLYRRDLLAQL